MKIIGNNQCTVDVFHHSLGDPSKFYDVNLRIQDSLGHG